MDMATARNILGKLKSSDGRIRVKTLSGVSALVAVIALLVGVLPVFASAPGPTTAGVEPVPVDWGGGSGACDDDLIALSDGTARGPSAARYEAHLNNPKPGDNFVTGNDPDGTQIKITVGEKTEFLAFSISAGMAAYDVVINGGKKSNHYAYDGSEDPGIVTSDSHLSAPTKDNKPNEVHKLSHVNICYDAPIVTFVCGGAAEEAFRFGDGEFTEALARIFTVGTDDECEKTGIFYIDNESPESNVKLDFGVEGPTVAGRLDVTKDFGDPNEFKALTYDGRSPGTFEEVPWCTIDRDNQTAPGPFAGLVSVYPELPTEPSGHTACKVYEEENADGVQYTVVYFEFEDPNFK
jgi:hypothetical protein